jgi:uncharacterized protein (DUF2225 family)
MTLILPSSFICPCCGNRFEGLTLRSTNELGGMTTDFRAYARGFQPLAYALVTCPDCGFTERSHGFAEPIPECLKEFVRLEITPFIKGKRLLTETRYEVATKIAEFSKKPPVAIAGLLLRAAWCAHDREPEGDAEKDYRRRAIDRFTQALDDREIAEEERLRSMYLIGEEFRRIGERIEAHKWFRMLIVYCTENRIGEHWARLAQEQMEQPREKFDQDDYLARICLYSL